ncbi:uncharacterized protein LOC114126486 [Aphis gossypii]|uniref:uncharacterized protein LOC114126486 n=1 Tax=Aphis gossypii TaxID=80765 RepID=UPI002158F3A5|nr:uncharacterized protein LOC114126486 [Aphis gossypii]
MWIVIAVYDCRSSTLLKIDYNCSSTNDVQNELIFYKLPLKTWIYAIRGQISNLIVVHFYTYYILLIMTTIKQLNNIKMKMHILSGSDMDQKRKISDEDTNISRKW